MAKLGEFKSDLLKKSPTKISVAGALFGIGADMVSAKRDEKAFIAELTEEYRPEIAERYNLAPEQLTEAHFLEIAKEAEILSQAYDVGKMDRKTKTLTSVISGIVGAVSGLVAGVFAWNASPLLENPEKAEAAEGLPVGKQAALPGIEVPTIPERGKKPFDAEAGKRNSSNIAGGLGGTLGAMVAGKITRRVLHKKSDVATAIEDTAHGAIMAIKDKQQHAETVTPMDVFTVMVATNPELGKAIEGAYGAPFKQLDGNQQQELIMTEFPEVVQYTMAMAERINNGARPQGLLFGEVKEVADTKDRPAVIEAAVEEEFRREESQAERENAEKYQAEAAPAPVSVPEEATHDESPEQETRDEGEEREDSDGKAGVAAAVTAAATAAAHKAKDAIGDAIDDIFDRDEEEEKDREEERDESRGESDEPPHQRAEQKEGEGHEEKEDFVSDEMSAKATQAEPIEIPSRQVPDTASGKSADEEPALPNGEEIVIEAQGKHAKAVGGSKAKTSGQAERITAEREASEAKMEELAR